MKKSYEMDMCSGPVLGKILILFFSTDAVRHLTASF